jgi:2-methylcitrate dehydratase PrpD
VSVGDRASHLTSLPYCMAIAAVAPDMAFEVQQCPPELPPTVRELMGKIKIAADESLLADYPEHWRARVRVVTGSGRREWLTTHIPGEPTAPFDRARVQAKFLRFIAPVLGPGKAEHIIELCSEAIASGHLAPLMGKIEQSTNHLGKNASV